MAANVSVVAALVAFSACDVEKSSNPLSPTVAGPIPGINISAPQAPTPAQGTKIASDHQPITLTVGNASSNGPRPLSYVFEVATDAGFANKVFSKDGVAPGTAKTSVTLDPLPSDKSYFWHARAQDGANTGPFNDASSFSVFTPIEIQPPVPIAPIAAVVTDSMHPTLQWNNAARTGPVGAITYLIQIATDSAFSNIVSQAGVNEQPGKTSYGVTILLANSTVYFWRVRAADPTTTGPFTIPLAFTTPAAAAPPVAPPTAPPGGGGGGGVDGINLAAAAVYAAPMDVASWPATGKITSLTMASNGLTFQFTTENTWPDYTPPGWSGPLEYTVWAVVNVGGAWYTSGFIQMWRGRQGTGAPIIAEFARNWAYDSRWGPMQGHQPVVGEQMGFFLTAGNARGTSGVTSVRERTNVVVVALPAGDSGVFTYSFGSMPFFIRR